MTDIFLTLLHLDVTKLSGTGGVRCGHRRESPANPFYCGSWSHAARAAGVST
jgi:hypothetical protein